MHKVDAGSDPVVLCFEMDDHGGPSSETAIREGHLPVVDEETARREAYLRDLIE